MSSTISGSTTAINLTSPAYSNPVTVTGAISLASAGIALGAATSWTVVNEAQIYAPPGGATYGVSLGAGGAIVNNGSATIAGGQAVAILHSIATVANYGHITGSTYGGVLLGYGGLVTNATGGTITGATHAVGIKTKPGTFLNNGYITDHTKASVVLLDGGYAYNQTHGTIRQSNDGFYVNGAAGTVVNSGYLYASIGHAVELDQGGSVTNTRYGRMIGQHAQVYSALLSSNNVPGNGPVTLVNSGLIEATATTSSAVVFTATINGGGTVSNMSGGTIAGGSHAILVHGGLGSVYNVGLLEASRYSVLALLSGGTIDNATGGRILGSAPTSTAVYVTGGSGIVINRGMIANATQSGIALFSGGNVRNYGSGTITGASVGVFIKGGAGTVGSLGTIEGGNGTAVYLSPGFANRVDYLPGAVFGGIVNGGNTIGSPVQSTLRLSYYTAHAAGTLTNLNSRFVNFQQISVRGSWVFGAGDSLLAGVTLTDSNSGTNQPTGTIGGYGLLLGANDAVTVDPAAVVTRANAATTHTAGIYATTGASGVRIVNYGLIENPTNTLAAGVALFDGGTIVNGTNVYNGVTSTGTIIGHDVGIYAIASLGLFTTLINAGVIQAVNNSGTYGGSGIDFKNAGLVSNLAGGTIVAPQNALVLEAGGSVYNDGLLVATDVTNSQGLYVNGGGVITNAAGGTIEGWAGIQVGTNVAGPVTVVNAGAIKGSYFAVQFQTAANNLLVLDPGAYIRGLIDGRNGPGSGFTTALQLAAGTVSGIFNTNLSPLVGVNEIDINAGANWTVEGTLVPTISAGVNFNDFGKLTLASGIAGNGSIQMGSGALLAFEPFSTPSPTINGFAGHETIEVVGALATGVTLNGSQLTIAGTGVTLNVNTALPASDFGFTNVNGSSYVTACFATGTSILTAAGPRPVELLGAGEVVMTATGRLATIRWIGHRRTDLRRHPSPHDAMPVRVRADAFGPGLPLRDLVLSPDHAVFVDGRLIPIRHLINGVSIVQETRASITYWHVELDRHDIVLAEGMACESYLDTGNRAAFENAEGPTELHPDFARRVWDKRGCAPILVDPAGPTLRAIHTRLLALARSLPVVPAAERSA